MDPSGAVEARIGASPHGQGLATALAQIIADELGVAPDAVRVVHGDTDRTPYGWGTFASRSLVLAGGACLLASRKLRQKLLAIAGTLLEADPADIALADGAARVAGTDRALPIADLARASYHQAHRFALEPGLAEAATYDPAGTFSNACHLAIVAVDVETCARRDRAVHRRRGCRPADQSDDRRGTDPRRRRAGDRQRAAGGDRLRRQRAKS